MQKKIMWAVLGTLLAVVIASVTLVFAVGRKTSADSEEETIGILDKAEYFNINEVGVLQGLMAAGEEEYLKYSKIEVVIPEGVVEISGLYDNDMGDKYNMFAIGHSPESEFFCGRIMSLVLPNSLQKIGECALAYCPYLTNVEIPSSVTYIDSFAFENSGLTTIVIPASVTEMRIAFENCDNLTTIYCEAESKPAGWSNNWNRKEGGWSGTPKYYDVVWGYVAPHTVTFNVNGGSAVSEQVIEHNTQVTKPTNPTKDDYTFVGWYTGEELTNEYDFASAVTSDLTLYAKWEEIVVESEEPEIPVAEEPTESETPVEDNKPENPVTEDDTNTKDKVNVAVIAGGVAGGVVVVGVIGGIIGFAIKKRKIIK